ncbi:hypothetical protein FSARC_3644 [Fusarium sarcochroum]|uniref:F-box domain-containing protein n=1 Tax=Fusarium sarcochroum TaxID=1208366 RepID=A0A8H4XC59_9HYPO|nr:hypothetical protein FSARC_3644 [Fusarium sarcochroum]
MTSSICRQILDNPVDPQQGSPLYTVLPTEIRTQIFTLILIGYPTSDPNNHEPIYSLKRKTDVEILRTCKAIYKECWHMPFILAEHSVRFIISHVMPSVPAEENRPHLLEQGVQQIRDCWDQELVTINSLRIFPRVPGHGFDGFGGITEVFAIPGLDVRKITLTIRHADWCGWEQDAPLQIEGDWIPTISRNLPPSSEELCIELETKTPLGEEAVLTLDEDGFVMSQSMVKSIMKFSLLDFVERKGGQVSHAALERAKDEKFEEGQFRVDLPGQDSIQNDEPFVYIALDDFWCGTAFLSSDDDSDGEVEENSTRNRSG